jgi:hypothetical protein
MATELTQEQQEKADRLRAFLKERAQDGKIFSVTFVKRTTGEIRQMVCRLGVKKHLKGGEKAFDDAEHRLLTVFDVVKKDYRSIACESITDIRLAGEEYHEPE